MRCRLSGVVVMAVSLVCGAPVARSDEGGDVLRKEIREALPEVDRAVRELLGEYDVAACQWYLARAQGLQTQPTAAWAVEDMQRLQGALSERVMRLDPHWSPPMREGEGPPRPPLVRRHYSVLPLLRAPDRPTLSPVIERGHHGNRRIEEDAQRILLPREHLVELASLDLRVAESTVLEDDTAFIDVVGDKLVAQVPEREQGIVEATLDRLARVAHFPVRVAVELVRLDAAGHALLRARGMQGSLLSNEAEAELERLKGEADRAAVMASEDVQLAWGQQALLRQGETRTFVADHEIEQTNSVIPVITSVVGALNLGFSCNLNVYRAAREDEVFIDATVVFATLRGELRRQKTDGGDLQLPEVAQMQLATTVRAPLGRTAMLGGWFPRNSDPEYPATGVGCFVRVSMAGK